MSENLKSIKHVFMVLSGKGGVGKSTIATQIALSLVNSGKKVGILDVDLCGPSIPHMLNLQNKDVHQCSEGWVPVYADKNQNLAVMSIGFLLKKQNDAVVWRGPKKNAMIKQFLSDVYWKDIEYLIIDTPPGTSDEHISTVEGLQALHPDGAVLVTTPQDVATADVKRELTFCRKTDIPILGIIENMSGYVCPSCKDCTNIFSSGGGQALAEQSNVPFLGTVPLDPVLTNALEKGNPLENFESSPAMQAVNNITKELIGKVEITVGIPICHDDYKTQQPEED